MSLVGNTPLQKNAMNHHGVKEAFFDTFFQKKATAQLSANVYTQSVSENFGRFSFTGKERDEETGYGYFGARYMDHELMTSWLSVDPMADKYPDISPYAYCMWNPVKLVDPDGRWVWNSAGDLKAQKGDDIFTMSFFLGTTIENCITILNRCGLINSSGINIAANTILPQKNLWVDAPISADYSTVDNTAEAVWHYYTGDGQPVNIGDESTRELFNSFEFIMNHNAIIRDAKKNNDYFSVNMTYKTFHIGHTNVSYTKKRGRCTSAITYRAFSEDGFWDPAFWSEHTFGKWGIGGDLYSPDRKGGHLETGGKPYDYIPRERTYFYKPEE